MTAADLRPGTRVLLDTNILLRLVSQETANHLIAQHAFERLQQIGIVLCVTFQNYSEFWNTATRPDTSNGLGLSPAVASNRLRKLEAQFVLLLDTVDVYKHWRILIEQHAVIGKQVHDARLTAIMLAHNIPFILTFNSGDFRRYNGIEVLDPKELAWL